MSKPVYIDSDVGKKLFLDFWKVPITNDAHADNEASIIIGNDFNVMLENALVLLTHDSEPSLLTIDNRFFIFGRVRPISAFPPHLEVISTIYDLAGQRG